VNQITDDGQLREHCKSLHARLSDALRVKAELQPSRLIAHQYQNMQHANVYGGMSASVHRPMGYLRFTFVGRPRSRLTYVCE
jgi:hypothetical protein